MDISKATTACAVFNNNYKSPDTRTLKKATELPGRRPPSSAGTNGLAVPLVKLTLSVYHLPPASAT